MSAAADQMPQQRTVIIHCHIFKNAGSSLDWALRRNFGAAFLDHRDDAAMKAGAAYLGPLLEDNTAVRALSSHRVLLPLPQVAGARLLPAFLIRDPVERAYSVYQFERMQNSETPGARMAKKLDFREYVTWRFTPAVSGVIGNFQTRYCAGLLGTRKEQLDNGDLEAAKAMLESTPLVGLVAWFDESMLAFEHALRPYFPNIDLSYVRQNARQEQDTGRTGLFRALFSRFKIGGDARTNGSPGAAAVLEMLGPELAGQLVRRNVLDSALHEWSRGLLRSRLERIPAQERELRDFRRRCARLNKGGPGQAAAGPRAPRS